MWNEITTISGNNGRGKIIVTKTELKDGSILLNFSDKERCIPLVIATEMERTLVAESLRKIADAIEYEEEIEITNGIDI